MDGCRPMVLRTRKLQRVVWYSSVGSETLGLDGAEDGSRRQN